MATLKPYATVSGEGGEEKGWKAARRRRTGGGRHEAANAQQIKSDLVGGSWLTSLRDMLRYVIRVLDGWNLAN